MPTPSSRFPTILTLLIHPIPLLLPTTLNLMTMNAHVPTPQQISIANPQIALTTLTMQFNIIVYRLLLASTPHYTFRSII